MSAEKTSSASSHKVVAWACAELERRLRSGEACRAEEFLQSHPVLSADADAAVELIATEYVVRRDLGELLDRSECYGRFPQWRAQLEQKLASPPTLVSDQIADTEPPSGGRSVPAAPAAPLSQHEVYEEIGHGGMGLVYRARDLVLKRDVALKRIRSGALVGTEVDRFYREARAAALLRHPNIVPIFTIGLYDGSPCYTMPLMTGGTVADHGARYAQDPRAAVMLMIKVARAVQAAHQAGIIHRDLKPGNILLDEHDEPLVADFGLAKVEGNDAEITRTGQAMGTLPYMAPEQIAGESGKANTAGDVWALGIILYQLLTGERPFAGKGRALEDRILKSKPAWPHALSRDLGAVVLKCLEKDPRRRYLSASDLASDLEAWLGGMPVVIPPRRRRRPWVLAALAVVPIVGLAFAASAVFPIREHDPGLAPAANLPPLPDVWIPMLLREPNALRWPDGGKNSHKGFDPGKRQLVISSEELALLAMGTASASRYQIRVHVQQTPLVGNIGVFFAYRESPPGEAPTQAYQVVELVSNVIPVQDRQLRVDWRSVSHAGPANGQGQTINTGLKSSPWFRPSLGEHLLELTVGPKGLEAVAWDGNVLLKVIDAGNAGAPGPEGARGQFGIYVSNGSGVFRDPRYLFHREPE